jgi:hypothetical protein
MAWVMLLGGNQELPMQDPTACSLELSATYFQLASSIFLSHNFQPLIFSLSERPAASWTHRTV